MQLCKSSEASFDLSVVLVHRSHAKLQSILSAYMCVQASDFTRAAAQLSVAPSTTESDRTLSSFLSLQYYIRRPGGLVGYRQLFC
jgi:hypothetical protein